MLTKMIETLKKNPRTIVFTEGTDNRILDAADKLTAEGILGVILLGTEEEVKAVAKAGNYNIDKCSIIDPAGYPEMDAMVAEMVKLRKGKMTEEQMLRLCARQTACWAAPPTLQQILSVRLCSLLRRNQATRS